MLNAADLSNALRRAFNLGQTYWQQADSENTSQHRKADQTRAKFEALVAETVAAAGVAGTALQGVSPKGTDDGQ
jgi:hypothetical protein